jgi:DMAP1-binding Domain
MSLSTVAQDRALPSDLRARLAQIDLEYQHGELTERGYEIRRARILSSIDMANLNFNAEPSGRLNTRTV